MLISACAGRDASFRHAVMAMLIVAWCGCAAKERFLSPQDLSADLCPPPCAESSDGAVLLTSAENDGEGDRFGRRNSGESPRTVVVTGLVRKPGELAFPEGRDFRLLDAIARSEGIPNKIVDTVVVCRRRQGHDERALIRVSLREATRKESANIRLMADDIISVEPTPITLMRDARGYVGAAAVGGGMLLMGGPH